MKKFWLVFLPGFIVGALIILGAGTVVRSTSSNDFCMSCHIHPAADAGWKKSVHYDTESGVRTSCIECHLPPKGEGYLWEKTKTGLRDLWGYWTKDSASFNWDERGRLEIARHHVF